MQRDPENSIGNSEYKLKLFEESYEHVSTQMRYRVEEGNGEAIYTVGILDNGTPVGLNNEEFETTKKVLQKCAEENKYTMTLISTENVDDHRNIYEYLIRENNQSRYHEIRLACIGNVDSGKSTLLGVLLSGVKDDGRGSARMNVFNFQHELKTGRTSSVTQHILGFDPKGDIVNYGELNGRKITWPEIVKKSSKIVTMIDLCGHEKYLKTTIKGLTSQFPDIALILVGANMGITKMTKEHIFLCLSLNIPFCIVMTKIDICEKRVEVLKDNISEIKKLIKSRGINRIPFDVKEKDDSILACKNLIKGSIIPIFYVSSVSGKGIDNIRHFLNIYNKPQTGLKSVNKVEMHVEKTFYVKGVGTVIGGQLINGEIKVDDELLVGPIDNTFRKISVRSIHCKRVLVNKVNTKCYVCLGIKKSDFYIPPGKVILGYYDRPFQVQTFDAEITVLKSHSTSIKVGYQPVLHVSSIRQTTKIISIYNKECERDSSVKDILRTGDKAIVKFRFLRQPEYISPNMRILLAEGQVKIIGKIIKVYEEDIMLKS